jgi:hypothetical protein
MSNTNNTSNNPLANRLELSLDIKAINKPPRKVNVRADLPASQLITAIRDHFNLDGNYELRVVGSGQVLHGEQPLSAANIQTGAVLECVRLQERSNSLVLIELGTKRAFSQKFSRVSFVEQRSFTEFRLNWWPAVIGRRDRNDPSRNKLLAVDLEQLDLTVSRHHACITEANGSFFVEALQDQNPLFVEDKRISAGIKRPLATGTTLRLGNTFLNFNVRD